MGWTFSHKPKSMTTKEYLEQEINCSNDHGTWTVLACKSKLHVSYLAIKFVNATENKVFAGVFLTKRVKGQFNFGYKDMDESMGPYERDCPKEILDLLTPTTSEYAIEWRKECRERLSIKKTVKKVKDGDTIIFDEDVNFGRYGKSKTFTRTSSTKNIYYAHEMGMSVRLTKKYLVDHNFRVQG